MYLDENVVFTPSTKYRSLAVNGIPSSLYFSESSKLISPFSIFSSSSFAFSKASSTIVMNALICGLMVLAFSRC